MQNLRHIIFIITVLLSLSSCDKKMESTYFAATMELLTPVVSNGGDFAFRINTDNGFTFSKVVCEFEDREVLNTGTTYSPVNGYCEFRFKGVSVTDEHNGEVAVTITDSKTGLTETLSAHYYCQL